MTVRSCARATPWGTPLGAQTSVPGPASRVCSPTIMLAFPETIR